MKPTYLVTNISGEPLYVGTMNELMTVVRPEETIETCYPPSPRPGVWKVELKKTTTKKEREA